MNANELANALDWVSENHLVGIGDADFKEAAIMLRQQQEQIDKLTAIVALRELNIERMIEKQSHYEALAHAGGVEAGKELAQTEIEALKQIIDANNLNQNIGQFVKPDLKIEEVMSENCTCYKLGYSPLNDYRKVETK